MHQITMPINNMTRIIETVFLGILLILSIQANTQNQDINTINAQFVTQQIRVDGHLDEEAWEKAVKIDRFIQREQTVGEISTEKTEVAILYDNNNLYIGVWCFQNDANSISTKFMQRDFKHEAEDNFKVIISTFNDGRNGYLFIINPNGARADAQVYGQEGRESNADWNGVWDVKSRITDKGWFAEIIIPFSTFQFKRTDELTWGINFERNITAKNEQSTWQGWEQNHNINSLTMAGSLTGIKGIGYSKFFEFKPYLLSSFEKEKGVKANFPAKYGFDLNINISPTLKLNLTTNTDFAQVETDRIAVNLTRFSLFYPEKRDFFLEGANQFSFKLGYKDDVFYSRQIGIENFQPVQILVGARLIGKIGKSGINLLSIQTAKLDSIPSTNNSVFRYKYDIGKQSYIGGIITSKINNESSNLVIGIDGKFITTRFLKNKNLSISAMFSKSFDDYKTNIDATAIKISIDYPNDFMDQYLGFTGIYADFNPLLGFLPRKNFESVRYNFRLTPRWFTNLGVNKLLLKPVGINVYKIPGTSIIESFENESTIFGFKLKSGDSFQFHLKQNFDKLTDEFSLTDNVNIPIGDYWMHQKKIELSTFDARKIWVKSTLTWGGFYGGNVQIYLTEMGININKNLNILNTYTYNFIKLTGSSVKTHEIATNINYAFNPRLNLALFGQYNSLEELLFFNFRLHWIPKIGSDLYFVYNHQIDEVRTQLDLLRPTISAGTVKVVWRFTF